jgi:uncharacterized protein YrzB (UPF0473 family)
MNDEYGSDFITITDEDGQEYELELLDTLEDNGTLYLALLVEDDKTGEDGNMVIMKQVVENGEEILSTLDSDEEVERIYGLFLDQMYEDTDEE